MEDPMKNPTRQTRRNGSAVAAAHQSQNREITLTLSPALCAALEHYAKGEGNRIEEFCEWVMFDSARTAGEDSETLQLHASALVSKGARKMERRMNPPIKSNHQAGTIPLVKPDARRALAAAQQSPNLNPGELASRRAKLAEIIAGHTQQFDVMHAFGVMLACQFEWPPGADCELNGEESAQYLAERAKVLSVLESRGANWFAHARSRIADEIQAYLGGEIGAEWKSIVDSLGLTVADFLAEAIVNELVQLSIAGQAKPLRAGGAA